MNEPGSGVAAVPVQAEYSAVSSMAFTPQPPSSLEERQCCYRVSLAEKQTSGPWQHVLNPASRVCDAKAFPSRSGDLTRALLMILPLLTALSA